MRTRITGALVFAMLTTLAYAQLLQDLRVDAGHPVANGARREALSIRR